MPIVSAPRRHRDKTPRSRVQPRDRNVITKLTRAGSENTRTIERVDGTRPLGGRVDHFPVYPQLDHRLRRGGPSAPPLDYHREPEQLERRAIVRGGAAHQHLE